MNGFVDFSSENFWGLGNRVVAIESVMSISMQMENLRPLLENLIPQNRKIFINSFYANAVKGREFRLLALVRYYNIRIGAPCELLRQIIIPFCKSAVPWKELLALIAQTNFNPREISSENSTYVSIFADRINEMRNTLARIHRNVSISDNIRQTIWVKILPRKIIL